MSMEEENIKKRGQQTGGGSRKKTKFGRNQLRKITRTTRRNQNIHNNSEEDTEHSQEDEESYKSDADIQQDTGESKSTNENKLAYNALVTLLKHEHPSQKQKKADQKTTEQSDDDNEEGLVGDLNDGDSEYEAHSEDEEGGVEIHETDFDPLSLHFQDENKIERIIKKFESEKTKLKLSDREKFQDESYIQLNYDYGLTDDCPVKSPSKLQDRLKYHNVKQKALKRFEELDPQTLLEKNLIESLLSYQNVNLQYYTLPKDIKANYQDYYLLHIVNHLAKSRDMLIHNNKKLKEDPNLECRDQGYTRPKALILLPTRNACWELVNKMINLIGFKQIGNRSRFKQEYYSKNEVLDKSNKPKEFKEFFKGNSNDLFNLGLRVNNSMTLLNLYSSYSNSDLIISSPLGLKMLIEKDKKTFKETNFLSSIEILIFDKTEGLLMSNWFHINEILNEFLNKSPTKVNETTDFSRIRMHSINDQNNYLMQTLLFSKYSTPEFNNLTNQFSKNLINGVAMFKPYIGDQNSAISQYKLKLIKSGLTDNKLNKLKQVFLRFVSKDLITSNDSRFEFFRNIIVSQIMNKLSYDSGTLIYIPSYIDYIRVKNYLKNETRLSFVGIDEYSSQNQLTKNRFLFKTGKAKIMLYTERLHFYKRIDIKGVKNVIFFGIPTDPIFYSEVLNFIIENKIRVEMGQDDEDENVDLNLCMIRIMFDKLDVMKLEKLVGLKLTNQLIKSDVEINEI